MVEQYVKPWVWILTLKDKKKKKKKAPCFKTPTNQAMWEPCQLQSPQDRAPHYLTMRHLTGSKKLSTEHSLFKVQNTKPLPFKKQKMYCFYCMNTWGFSQMQIINLQAQWFRYTNYYIRGDRYKKHVFQRHLFGAFLCERNLSSTKNPS